ncbi:MAG: hypothetical protein ACREQV_10775 [Candidatus Binatia bacterium]
MVLEPASFSAGERAVETAAPDGNRQSVAFGRLLLMISTGAWNASGVPQFRTAPAADPPSSKHKISFTPLEGQINDLESKMANAWNDNFVNQCRGWINEKHRKIADIETTIRELDRRIRDIRQKIGY